MASIINASTAGAGGVITTADASGVLQLQSGGTTGISINTAGYVNMPTQPMISAWHTATEAPAANTPLVQWTTTVNTVPSAWTAGTATYTVPVSGKYLINISLLHDAGTNPAGGVRLYINGANVGRLMYAAVNAGYLMCSGQVIYSLTAGNTIQFIQEATGSAWYGDSPGLGSFTISMIG
jgi:hypothetical protein